MGRSYDFDELYPPSRFLHAEDFKGKTVTLTISDVIREEFDVEEKDEDGRAVRKKEVRGILAFEKTEKQLGLNRTNGECIKGMFGRVTGEWIGKRVTLAPERVRLGREMVDGIRVKGSPDIAADRELKFQAGRRMVKVIMSKTEIKATPSAKTEEAPSADAAM